MFELKSTDNQFQISSQKDFDFKGSIYSTPTISSQSFSSNAAFAKISGKNSFTIYAVGTINFENIYTSGYIFYIGNALEYTSVPTYSIKAGGSIRFRNITTNNQLFYLGEYQGSLNLECGGYGVF
jgi:hypothetical protein